MGSIYGEAVTTAPPGNRQHPDGPRGPALLTDHYELTMLEAALRDGTSNRRCSFEVFSRRLPEGRRYGVVAGTGRLIDAITSFRYDEDELAFLADSGVIGGATCEWLAGFRFGGDVSGYAEGELYFPGSPVLTVDATFAEGVVLETLALSILNHDAAVASAAARMVVAAGDRPCIEMGSRRTHEQAAVASARAAYLGGFAATSNLAAGFRHGVPTAGTAAHAFTLLHDR
jgi:nicotinate phosphoribosyltransferase